jgi:hypothetical protein
MTKAKTARRKGKVRRVPLVEYHVIPNGKRWDVERDDTFIGSFAYDVHTAVGWLPKPLNVTSTTG